MSRPAISLVLVCGMVFWFAGCGEDQRAPLYYDSGVEDVEPQPEPQPEPEPPAEPMGITSVAATPTFVEEGSATSVTLSSVVTGDIDTYDWQQVSGPRVTLVDASKESASFDAGAIETATDLALDFELTVTSPAGTSAVAAVQVVVEPTILQQFPMPYVQIGGATTRGFFLHTGTGTYVIANVGGTLESTRLGLTKEVVNRLPLPGFVSDLLLIQQGFRAFALVAAGHEGLLVVEVTEPTGMKFLHQVHVNYYQDGLTWAEGGGDIIVDQEIGGMRGQLVALATDGSDLFIANADYGIHRTALSNVLAEGGPVLEADGTLLIDAETYTIQYAGEKPWGGPHSLLYEKDRLFAALGELGMVIYDPVSLERVGAYNLYTDVSVTEDWFADADITTEVQPGFLDPVTGMPDYRQTSFEILEIMHGEIVAPTPWADFDITGKYYYTARKVVVAEQGSRDIAYIAYALGGLVAVDITGYETATPGAGFVQGGFLGFLPAVPAHGPAQGSSSSSSSLLPHEGAGRLAEAGITDVALVEGTVIATDHFAGMFIVDGAGAPGANWRGAGAPYDNDTDGIPGNHVPTMEAVTSFDMSAFDSGDEESLPCWMYEAPSLLVTGEVGGHGVGLLLADPVDFMNPGNADVVMLGGAGGMSFLDIVDITNPVFEDRFAVPVYHPTTEEIGAAVDGTPTQPISIGHADGIAVRGNYLYVADGPHGLSVWQIADDAGSAYEHVHLVANSLQDEYPQDFGGATIYPSPHATKVNLSGKNHALVCCASAGLRRVDLAPVRTGGAVPGAPRLLPVTAEDIYEHQSHTGVTPLRKQDHCFDVVVRGDLAYTADGSNGMTIYDLSVSPLDPGGGFFVSNIGGATGEKPVLGISTGIALWDDPGPGGIYALVAAGPRGIGVVDVTDPYVPVLIKVFEPIKIEDGTVGHADGRAADLIIIEDLAIVAYDSFGVLAYKLADLVAPLPPGIPPTEVWSSHGEVIDYDYRPVAVSRFRLQDNPGQEETPGGALSLAYQKVGSRISVYVAYGEGGLVWIDWTDPLAPDLMEVAPTAGGASDVALGFGRIYVADHGGGLVFFK